MNSTRFAIILLCIVLTVGALVYTVVDNSNRVATWVNTRDVITVVVERGDTLDEFGYKYKPNWMDIREYRYEIMELNNLDTGMLHIGQELKLYA